MHCVLEWLKYDFINETENSATVALQWEKLMIPFKIEVDLIATQLASFRNELRTDKGFMWEAWNQAAQWCLQNNVNLDQALLWSDTATSQTFGGDRSFQSWSTKSDILNKLGKTTEADSIMKKALPYAGIFELHQYGRQLLQQKKYKEALAVFKMNYDKNPNQFVTLMGLTRGYSANGDYKTALKYALQAQQIVPDSQNKASLATMIEKLQQGKDVN